MKFIVLACLAATGSALNRAADLHAAYAPFEEKEHKTSLRKAHTETSAADKIQKTNGKLSLARLNFEKYQDVDRSGQPITGEVANILAALPNRQLDTNFL